MIDINFLQKFGIVDFGYTEDLEASSWKQYNEWVDKKNHEPLQYLCDERKEKRKSLKEVFPEVKSALVFLFSYHDSHLAMKKFYQSSVSNHLKIGSYVFGFEDMDYHHVLKERLTNIGEKLKESTSDLNFKLAVDTSPILERDLAFRSGLGWFGKNSMLIGREHGSFHLIGSLLLDKVLDIKTKSLETDHCGQCTSCADSCPTNAINLQTRQLHANRCISTFTIEMFKDTETPKGYTRGEAEIFGCDICQDVCPWNKRLERRSLIKEKVVDGKIKDFFLKLPKEKIIQKLESWSNRQFQREFKGTALERTGRIGLLKNLKKL